MENARSNVHPIDYRSDTRSTIDYSGNSDVDIEVNVDTTPIAYAMLCTLLATKQISDFEFKKAVRRLEDLTKKGRSPTIRDMNDLSQVKLYKKR
ncbi:hypothetical protein [Oceanobacillus indicireducens]|uniref:Uncharacterized protein n=1 Tax=Oceanobacillus indicireducens TaxID=1004261 RepID=A0A918D1H4_9BACI|nr:hypothetical protein [Oceanobacillus indicireducens]GGN57436.1 hypothetical protein GCM10007971_18350 [Oceanobacillus indicireducens]